jgi:type I restriction enzyme S subunit
VSVDEWQTPALTDLVDDVIGGLWGSPPDSAKHEDVDVLVVRGADFRAWDTRRAADAAPRRIPTTSLPRRKLEAGDLVVEVSGGGPAQPVGRVLVIDEQALTAAPLPLICSNFCRKVRLKPGVDPFFVKRQLDWLYRSGHTDQFQTSTTNIRNLQVEDFLQGTTIMLPDDNVQRCLTALLDDFDVLRDSSSAHITSARRAVECFRQAILAAACSGRLTADWRTEHSPNEGSGELVARSQRSLAAKRRPKTSDMSWMAPKWLDLPDSWCWSPLRQLAEIRGGIQKQPKRAPGDNAYPYLRVANVLRGRLELSEIHQFQLFGDELAAYKLEPGDLLVVEGNGSASEIGRSALWHGEIEDCVHQNHIIRVRCVAMEPRFVDFFWNSPIGSREVAALAVTSAGLYSLSTAKIGSVTVPVAPLDEQREIVRRVEGLLDLADRLLGRVESASVRVDRTSQAVLAKAFRGKLVAVGDGA